MALVHNVIIRGYNSIYLQAPAIKPNDVSDFIQYCLAWHETVKDHHHAEEAVLFPLIEEAVGEKGIMDGEVAEHGQLRPFPPFNASSIATALVFSVSLAYFLC